MTQKWNSTERVALDRSSEGRPFIYCYECSGPWRGMYVGYDHKDGCSRARPKPYPVAEQQRHEAEAKKEEAACPAHRYVPAIECPACYEEADKDDWPWAISQGESEL